ncbi:putative plant self-incompatibility S1 [Helianthus anomalus]
MKSLFFLSFYLVIITNASPITNTQTVSLIYNTTKKACFFDFWTVYIYNGIKDPIIVHVQSGDDDLGNHTLTLNNNGNWSFCQTLATLYYAYFYWNSMIVVFDVFHIHTSQRYCTRWKFRKVRRCFWILFGGSS